MIVQLLASPGRTVVEHGEAFTSLAIDVLSLREPPSRFYRDMARSVSRSDNVSLEMQGLEEAPPPPQRHIWLSRVKRADVDTESKLGK